MKKLIFISSLFVFSTIGIFANAAAINDTAVFNIEPSYDLSARQEAFATLRKISPSLYFFIDDNWWNGLAVSRQLSVLDALTNLSEEFENKIYPTLTKTFGEEWRPGIDRDTRITILLHPMRDKAGGYWSANDEYLKSQSPRSNEREIIYLNATTIESSFAKIELAHELQHMISFNQKTRILGVIEDVWLNEARSEYASTLLGYDDVYEGSNLQQRVRNFLDKPYDSLTEWQNLSADYGAANIFTQYLVDRYGVEVLTRSLRMQKAGIDSINSALKELGFPEDFSQIFVNWAIANYLNDCNISQSYCYSNKNLRNFRVVPMTNFLPMVGQSTLSIVNTAKDWAGNWFKFMGGRATLKVEFSSFSKDKFKVPYIVNDASGRAYIDSFVLDSGGKGEIILPDFGSKIISVTIIPNVGNKLANFTSQDPSYQFSWVAATVDDKVSPNPSPSTSPSPVISPLPAKENLILQIANLQKEIAKLQAQLAALQVAEKLSCAKFENNLYLGLKDSAEVRCLQEFLKNKGTEIYPEGLVTGNFLSRTFEAVKKYQASKNIIQTGFWGPLIRAAANGDLPGLTSAF